MGNTLTQTDSLGHLEQQKKERSLEGSLNEDKRGNPEEENAADNTVEKDQSEMQKMRALNQQRLQAKKAKKIDARKIQKASQDKIAKALVQKLGMRVATAAFLASVIGAVIGLLLVIFRLIAVDMFQMESQKFDSIAEELIYRIVAVLLIMIFFVLMALILFILVKVGGILGVIYSFLEFLHII